MLFASDNLKEHSREQGSIQRELREQSDWVVPWELKILCLVIQLSGGLYIQNKHCKVLVSFSKKGTAWN